MRPGRWVAFALALTAGRGPSPTAAAAQLLEVGRAPAGIRMSLVSEPYELHGETAGDILAELRALAPSAGWLWFPLTYSWRYEYEPVRLSDGSASSSCRVSDMTLQIDFRAAYPTWVHAEVAPDLVAAWSAFEEGIQRSWAARQANAIAHARQVLDAARRLEYSCGSFTQRLDFVAREAWSREPSDRAGAEPAPSLRWPPEGFESLLVERPGPPQPAEPRVEPSAASTSDAPSAPGSVPDPEPRVSPRLDVAEAVSLDLEGIGGSRASDGFLVGVLFGGQSQFVDGFEGPSAAAGPMTEATPFAFRAFTEVLVGALAGVLDEAEVLDLDAPIRDVIPELAPRLGTATLEQLLSHRAGLDNAAPRDTAASWSTVLDELNDRAVFTDPGILYSHSRYSYGMATRVIEAASGSTLQEALTERLLTPLGLTGTSLDASGASEGLPVAWTTAQDLMAFWQAWWGGRIPGSGPQRMPAEMEPGPAGSFQAFYRGVWADFVTGSLRLILVCGNDGVTAGFHVLPGQQAMVAFGSHGSIPVQTMTFIIGRLGEAFGMGGEIFGPGRLDGGGTVGEGPERCSHETLVGPRRPADFGPVPEAGNWPGRYLNGDRYFLLAERDGVLVSQRGADPDPYQVRHFGGSTYFVGRDFSPFIGFPIELLTDRLGRRYVVLDHRAYIHEDDRRR
jgi:CubicO group peptidase (beta-lactamase class C family)/predicted secreted Zn-dependent protease